MGVGASPLDMNVSGERMEASDTPSELKRIYVVIFLLQVTLLADF